MATIEKLHQAVVEKINEFTTADSLRASADTIDYAIQHILAEGNRFSEKDTLSIIRALNILRNDLKTIQDLRVSIALEEFKEHRHKD